jgi:hypothetical protein
MVLDWLDGYKTYIVGVIWCLLGLTHMYFGEEGISELLTGLSIMGVRSALNKL